MRGLFPRKHSEHDQQPTCRVIHPGEPPEQVSIVHKDGSISEVTVSGDDDELDVQIEPSLTHPPHLHGRYA